MDRFVAMIWSPAEDGREAIVSAWTSALRRNDPRWTKLVDRPGFIALSLIQRGDAPVAAMMDDGVVIGPIFQRSSEKHGRLRTIDVTESRKVRASRGDHLIKSYWGNYVAFWRDERGITLLRDPCGAVPCFISEQHGATLIFSHAEDVADLAGVRFSIDWRYMQAFLLFNYFVTQYTGLAEVHELLPGERLEWRADGARARSFAWNAAKIASQPRRNNFKQICDEFRATAFDCFHAWGNEYQDVLVSLSGGLDSSILINLLSRASDARIHAVHYLGVDYERYELDLAKAAADNAGVNLIVAEQDPSKDDITTLLHAPRLARPRIQSLAVLIDEISQDIAERTSAHAFMIGQGGDNLFLQRGGATNVLADYVRLNGLTPRTLSIAYNAATLQQRSVWGVLGDLQSTLSAPWDPFAFLENKDWAKYRPLNEVAVRTIPDSHKVHPWYGDAHHLPRGKADHVVSIVALYNYYLHQGRGITRDISYPFFSQPITELALRTPTYVLTHNGADRAVERAAFGDIIPEAIARRTGKGSANTYLLRVMDRHNAFYRDLLLNGELIRQDLLDRDKVELMLRPEYSAHGGGISFVYLLVAAELWLHTWRARSARAAA